MIIGTTPTHTFNIPIETSSISDVRIIYAQNGEVILTKESSDCTLGNKAIITKLTQEDTFKFTANKYPANNFIQVQIRIKTTNGDVLSSRIKEVRVDKCLEKEVL